MKQNRLADLENRLVTTAGRREVDWEFGTNRCSIIYRMDKQQNAIVHHRDIQ